MLWPQGIATVCVFCSLAAHAGNDWSYSVIDDDSRPTVLPDGGTRDRDSARWQSRFQELCQAVARNALARDRFAQAASSRRSCTSQRKSITVQQPAVWVNGRRLAQPPTTKLIETTTCVDVPGSADAQAAWAQASVEWSAAKVALDQLNLEADSAKVPLKYRCRP